MSCGTRMSAARHTFSTWKALRSLQQKSALGFGIVVVLDGVLQKRVQPLDLLNCIVSPPSTTGFI